MDDLQKTKGQLLAELQQSRQRIVELENQNANSSRPDSGYNPDLELLRTIADNLPNSYLSIIEKDYTTGFTAGAEFKKQGLDPESFIGLTLDEVFGDNAPLIKDHYRRAFEGEEISFEIQIGDQDQLYRVVPLPDEDGTVSRILAVVENISEQKQANAKLKKSEAEFRAVLENTRDLLYKFNLQTGTYDFLSESIKQACGFSVEEYIAGGIELAVSLIHPSDQEKLQNHIEHLLNKRVEDEIDPTIEYRFKHKTDGWKWFSDNRTILYDENNTPVGVVGNSRDITERKRVETELAESRALFQAVINQSPIPMAIASPTGELTYNPACAEHLRFCDEPGIRQGISLFEIEQPWQDFDPDGNPVAVEDLPLALAMQGITTKGREIRVVRKDGSEKWEIVNAAPIYNDDEELIAAFVAFPDITELKRAEEKLRESEVKHRTYIENAPEGIFVADAKARYQEVNKTACLMTGYSRDELLAMSIPDLIPAGTSLTSFEQLKLTGTASTETTLVRKDGTTFDCVLLATALPDGRYIAFCSDISDRKQAEQERLSLERQVQHAQKLESLGVLAGGIAHDFNNLLMAILGNADLALDELSPHSPARDNIKEIEKASKRAAELAKQMLAYSGKGQFVIEPINLNEFVAEMSHLLEVSISKKAVLKYNFADNLPDFDGDATQIRQIIMNLITNASEAIGDQSGVLALSTGAMDCDRVYLDNITAMGELGQNEALPEGQYTYIEVADTGCGMARSTIEKVFDPFFTTKFTGRGLGMSAVLGIVRAHQGMIRVHSEVGKGTTFRVLFPAHDISRNSTAIGNEGKRVLDDWRGCGTVLLVDDEETICSVGKQMLERMGYSVLTAANGRQAIDIFGEHADDIVFVLLDLTMPHLDGKETFRELHRVHADVKVILCSGYSEQDATQRFTDEGLIGFIQKPYDMVALKKILMEVMGPSHETNSEKPGQGTT